MCGRFSFAFTKKIIEERFDLENTSDYRPRYNCAPSQYLAVITNENPKKLSYLKWGLIPYWAKDSAIGSKLINAKAETITDKPSFKNAFINRRCLVPADGFYEWTRDKEKNPFCFSLNSMEPFSMAGIWESWNDKENNTINTFSIITTSANELVKKVHDRMPVILEKSSEKDWLFSTDPLFLQSMLNPYSSEKMKVTALSKLVNSVKNDSSEIQNIL